jgi:pyruvate,orthophosphate dikinase
MTKWVYGFGDGQAEGTADLKNLLGGKGANLAEMSNLGLPVPPGFTITTEVCTAFYDAGEQYPDDLSVQVDDALTQVEMLAGARFGDASNPLLVSVRSGARASMPGMMDTVLNLGLNDETVAGLAALSGDERFAYDSYRRFIQMYGDVVLGVDHYLFEDLIEDHKHDADVTLDTDLTVDDWKAIVDQFKALVERELGKPFPTDPKEQLWGAISAVFMSWRNDRANTYRRLHNIPEAWGTAVNVQAMVFGNMGEDSATGVTFTRNPSTGENEIYGEYLINAQGEDVVAGIRTPQQLTIKARQAAEEELPSMEEAMPETYAALTGIMGTLETHYRDMQDIEFTVQSGKLWMLQTRSGKRTAAAALKIAVEMASEGVITREEALMRIEAEALDQLLHPTLDPDASRTVITSGSPASPGAASGVVMFDADSAERAAHDGHSVILVRIETSPEDIHGMHASKGILTSRGGMTSHAAVVARGMGRPCVSGAGTLNIDYAAKVLSVGGHQIREGDIITIDGSTGDVMLGPVETIDPVLSDDFQTLMAWADDVRRLKVRANAEIPDDARTARDFGAEGIGLCRTEHMFFESDRIPAVREMILAETETDRRRALAKILPMQRQDFVDLFSIMEGRPVTIRLLDPPLHEFLPRTDAEMEETAKQAGVSVATIRARAHDLHEFNPMLGHRGCRLGISYPEIYEMQARAIFEAMLAMQEDRNQAVVPEIMIPLVGSRRELDILKHHIDGVANELGIAPDRGAYIIGTMIELPRAALMAGDIAETAEFFSFGTNDLTQTTFGLSRDDSGAFLEDYIRGGIFARDPFVSIDKDGVGQLVELAAERGKSARADIKLGICGEHGGDPASIAFCESIGLDYVSCSPYRVPIARLSAAQAALQANEDAAS